MLSLLCPSRHRLAVMLFLTVLAVSGCVPISLPLLAAGTATQVAVSQGWHSSLMASIGEHLGQGESAQSSTHERRLPDHCHRVEGGTVCVLD